MKQLLRITRCEATVIALTSMGIDPHPSRRANIRIVQNVIKRLYLRHLMEYSDSGAPMVTRLGMTALRGRFEREMRGED